AAAHRPPELRVVAEPNRPQTVAERDRSEMRSRHLDAVGELLEGEEVRRAGVAIGTDARVDGSQCTGGRSVRRLGGDCPRRQPEGMLRHFTCWKQSAEVVAVV